MKLVIDIDEEEYKLWKSVGMIDALAVRNALQTATPLEKVLEDIKGEIDDLDVSDLGKMGIITAIFEIIDKHISGKEKE